MLKKAAMLFGIVFLLIGVLGFVPGITVEGDDGMNRLLGIFMVDGVHNLVHILSGLAALAASQTEKFSRLYFQVFDIVYGLVTVLGFIGGDHAEILGFLHANTADHFLHLAITLVSLYLGFVTPRTQEERREDGPATPTAV